MSRLNVRLDAELQRGIAAFAARSGLTISQAARDLLRQALGHANPVDRGWREGFAAGHAEHQRRVLEASAPGSEEKRQLPPWMRLRAVK